MNTPFQNDMFAIVWKAFRNLFPDKFCICEWVEEIRESEDGNEIYGLTEFDDDGSVWVFVKATIPVKDAVEILAHELAHVAVGMSENHSERWENAFEAIRCEYNRLMNKMFPEKEEEDVKL